MGLVLKVVSSGRMRKEPIGRMRLAMAILRPELQWLFAVVATLRPDTGVRERER